MAPEDDENGPEPPEAGSENIVNLEGDIYGSPNIDISQVNIEGVDPSEHAKALAKIEVLEVKLAIVEAANKQNSTEEEIQAAGEALKVAGELEEMGAKFDSWEQNKLARAAYWNANFEVSKKYCEQAIQGFRVSKDKRGEASALINLGNISASTEEYAEAIEIYQKAARICKELGDWEREVSTLINIGTVSSAAASLFSRTGQERQDFFKLALECYDAAVAESLKHEFITLGVGCAMRNSASTHLKMGHLDEAEKAIKDGLTILKIFSINDENKTHYYYGKFIMAEILLERGEFDRAEGLVHSTVESYNKLGLPPFGGEGYRLLGRIAWKKNDFVDSERHLRAYVRTRNEGGLSLPQWYTLHGFTNPDADWDFPPPEVE